MRGDLRHLLRAFACEVLEEADVLTKDGTLHVAKVDIDKSVLEELIQKYLDVME